MLIVPDATKDYRFSDNPLVISDPLIRFYAGAPLITSDKYFLGTLCVIDPQPKNLTPKQISQLKILSRLFISQLELRRAIRLKDHFLANISHELRTPLNAILGLVEVLREEIVGNVNKEQMTILSNIEDNSLHLLSLINDILDLSKIESSQLNLKNSLVNIPLLCSSSLVSIKQQVLQKHIQLEIKIPSNLPYLYVDEQRIRQVVINLLTNAVKFTPEGGKITLEAFLWSKKKETTQQNYLQIAVIDTGIGIAPENIKEIFQPFVQIDSKLNREYAGMGLGLSLVKQIVELHNGQVGVTSELGVGSCFTVDLPCPQK